MPPAAVQRNASVPGAETLWPTTTEPSPETRKALLSKIPPGRSPKPVNDASEADAALPMQRLAARHLARVARSADS